MDDSTRYYWQIEVKTPATHKVLLQFMNLSEEFLCICVELGRDTISFNFETEEHADEFLSAARNLRRD